MAGEIIYDSSAGGGKSKGVAGFGNKIIFMMNNENLKPGDVENNQELLLLKRINSLEEQKRKLEWNIAELNVENEKLKHDLIHDSLTGLNTRKYLEERAEKTISSFKNTESNERKEGFKNLSLLFCDIDNFKKINDTFGHHGGDEVLKKISEIINNKVRTVDIVCRWGGDEIVVGLFGADEEEAAKIGEDIRVAVEKELKDKGVTMSVGAISYEKGLDIKSITDRGDKAMYWAKEKGRNNVVKYSDFLEAEKIKKQEEDKK